MPTFRGSGGGGGGGADVAFCGRRENISEEKLALALGEIATECDVAGRDCLAEKKVRERESSESDQCFPR